MAAITPTNVYRENVGSLTLLINNITTTTTSDTYQIGIGAPVLSFWCQSNIGNGFDGSDITWNPTTGNITMTGGTTGIGAMILYILMRT